MSGSSRILAFDWLRGLSVLVMVQTHALALLRPELRAGPLFDRIQALDGLVAPSFTFAAGFSIALVQVRGARAGQRARRVRRTARRILEVLFMACVVNWMWFPVFREPVWLLRLDILHCIGLSLLLALPLLALLAPRPRAIPWVTLGLALLAFGLAPLAEAARGPLAHFVNVSSGSLFPLLPWAGYVYLGATVGALAALDERRRLLAWLVALAALGWAVHLAPTLWERLYPPHAFWITDPTNHGNRWAIVCLLVLALLWLERRIPQGLATSAPLKVINVFATSSLAAYFFHEALLFKPLLGASFEGLWGNRCGWPLYWALTALLLTLTFGLSWLTDRAYRVYDRLVSGAATRPPVPGPLGAPTGV
ncbi:MAG: heparan-alpha-glucosaminide N-acetyltransferase domain-containing protein [Myxococcales bacterium]